MDTSLSVLLQSEYPVEQEGKDLYRVNSETEERGLSLSRVQALELARTHRKALDESGRIEIGTETVRKIIRTFSHSDYISQKEYSGSLSEVMAVFYELKNEADDRISDDDLISQLFDAFERYRGSLEPYLKSRELNRMLRTLRFGRDYDAEIDADQLDEDEKEEPDE